MDTHFSILYSQLETILRDTAQDFRDTARKINAVNPGPIYKKLENMQVHMEGRTAVLQSLLAQLKNLDNTNKHLVYRISKLEEKLDNAENTL